MRILVFGLPGSGKSFFSKELIKYLGDNVEYLNGDEIRKRFDDWDFSIEGRTRQAQRILDLSLEAEKNGKYVVMDFVCPTNSLRYLIKADIHVYMNRKPVRDYPDTTSLFQIPFLPNYTVKEDTDTMQVISNIVYDVRRDEFDPKKPTALMIGRYQPFHAGHKALFLKALEKHGQVCIAIRDMPRGDNNPYNAEEVSKRIEQELINYVGKYIIEIVPNIVDVVYGRDVGWTVSKIDLPPEIEAISATKIREGVL